MGSVQKWIHHLQKAFDSLVFAASDFKLRNLDKKVALSSSSEFMYLATYFFLEGVWGCLVDLEVCTYFSPYFSIILWVLKEEILSLDGLEKPSDFADFLDFETNTFWEASEFGCAICISVWVVVLGIGAHGSLSHFPAP